MGNRTLALFDFDGTITTHDTLFLFAKFVSGAFRFRLGVIYLSPFLLAHKLGLLPALRAKEIFISHYFKGTTTDQFASFCNRFCDQLLPGFIRPAALEALREHKKQQARIVIVSASPEDWILPWAIKHNIEVIATVLEKTNERLTGKLQGANCNGQEKVNRIRERIVLSDYDEIIAYGDSKGDKEMLSIATKKYFKPFRDNG